VCLPGRIPEIREKRDQIERWKAFVGKSHCEVGLQINVRKVGGNRKRQAGVIELRDVVSKEDRC